MCGNQTKPTLNIIKFVPNVDSNTNRKSISLTNSSFIGSEALYKIEKLKNDNTSQLEVTKSMNMKNYDHYYAFLSNIINKKQSSPYSSKQSRAPIEFNEVINARANQHLILHTEDYKDKSLLSHFSKQVEREKRKQNQVLTKQIKMRYESSKETVDRKPKKNKPYKKDEQYPIENKESQTKEKILSKFRMKQNKIPEIKKEISEEIDLFCLLPHEIIVNIVLFIIDNYREILKVNKSWMTTILSAFDTYFNRIENHAIYINMENFIFLNSYLGSTVYKIENSTKLKLDRILELELASGPPHSTLIVSYTFKYYNDKSTYKCTYKIDIVDDPSRSVWVHRSIANVILKRSHITKKFSFIR